MGIIKTATGKEFESGYFIESVDSKYITFDVDGEKPETVNDVFCDPEETMSIEYNNKTYEGYTRFGNIQVFYGSVRVRLDKHG